MSTGGEGHAVVDVSGRSGDDPIVILEDPSSRPLFSDDSGLGGDLPVIHPYSTVHSAGLAERVGDWLDRTRPGPVVLRIIIPVVLTALVVILALALAEQTAEVVDGALVSTSNASARSGGVAPAGPQNPVSKRRGVPSVRPGRETGSSTAEISVASTVPDRSSPSAPRQQATRTVAPASGGAGTTTTTIEDGATVFFLNCSQAWAASAAPIAEGEPGYRSGLDADGDGVACESSSAGSDITTTTTEPATTSTVTAPSLYTTTTTQPTTSASTTTTDSTTTSTIFFTIPTFTITTLPTTTLSTTTVPTTQVTTTLPGTSTSLVPTSSTLVSTTSAPTTTQLTTTTTLTTSTASTTTTAAPTTTVQSLTTTTEASGGGNPGRGNGSRPPR